MDSSASQFLLCTSVLVQVAVHPAAKESFEQKYRAVCGEKPRGQSYGESKDRGTLFEMYFSGPEVVAQNLRMLGYKVEEFQKGEYRYCSKDEQLFWKLVRNGFRIGDKIPQPA